MTLTDALDELISEGRIAPQLAMKILSNFDRHVAEVLAERVKANLTFKVRLLRARARAAADGRAGQPRHVPLLRRGLDVPHQERDVQVPAAAGHAQRHHRQDQDCVVQLEAPGRAVGARRRGGRRTQRPQPHPPPELILQNAPKRLVLKRKLRWPGGTSGTRSVARLSAEAV